MSTATCQTCNREASGNFCSHCGAQVGRNVGYGLLRHCEKQLEMQETFLANRRAAFKERGHNADEVDTKTSKIAASANKWRGWAEFVRNILDKSNPPPPRENT